MTNGSPMAQRAKKIFLDGGTNADGETLHTELRDFSQPWLDLNDNHCTWRARIQSRDKWLINPTTR